ncbi:MAG: (d)CMP kinase [Aristaeellaceae bacterium]
MALSIALDGPVGAGKSTIADEVARRLGILHLDTGAMYRAVGLSALRRGIDIQDETAVTAMCRALHMAVSCGPEGQRTLVDGEDVTGMLRTEAVSLAASTVARYPGVRQAMVALQQQLAATTDMLVDGRDIGTNVLPGATVKIYLTASAEERARRRYVQLTEQGGTDSYEQVLADLHLRDDQDMHRAVSPLRVAEDAVVVDSTGLVFEQTVEKILQLVKEKHV